MSCALQAVKYREADLILHPKNGTVVDLKEGAAPVAAMLDVN